ncbi:hypothetical protein [Winogradskyella jejuensis]|uniref:Uncharacterized protein n=1 Tax=Winogradskyella jejuensis TaxID=1089305 RepID=A0A1M5LAQ5_9FLAO|nr:hypothetical protein [Winogradskyella jejuensis]SHG62101.1 hypothetical protein SAMN05444148_0570 [Winogradskyella jejuensis]
MPEAIIVSNMSIVQIDNGENFQSPENPLVYSSAVTDGAVNVTVIAPFHNNVNSDVLPTITATVGEDGNDVFIQPSYDASKPLSTIYTQVVKIAFTLGDVATNMGSAVINVTVDEEGAPSSHPGGLAEPRRKTKVVASGG